MEANEKIEELYERIWQLEKDKLELKERNSMAILRIKGIQNLSNGFGASISVSSLNDIIKILDGTLTERYINDLGDDKQ